MSSKYSRLSWFEKLFNDFSIIRNLLVDSTQHIVATFYLTYHQSYFRAISFFYCDIYYYTPAYKTSAKLFLSRMIENSLNRAFSQNFTLQVIVKYI